MIPIIHCRGLIAARSVRRTHVRGQTYLLHPVDWLSLAAVGPRALTHIVVVKIDRKFRANAIFVISLLEWLRTALIRVEQFITLHTAL